MNVLGNLTEKDFQAEAIGKLNPTSKSQAGTHMKYEPCELVEVVKAVGPSDIHLKLKTKTSNHEFEYKGSMTYYE